ncbi:MAG: hypothetical protein D6718_00210 [Acidobacteria bacterium]|nr:MAG: hypothetical protein D6718_00210 [Acidobacteriota bacterium]
MRRGAIVTTNRATGFPGAPALAALLALLMLASACASTGRSAYRRAELAESRELWDQAVLSYAKAVALDPGNSRYKVALARAKLRAAAEHFRRAKRFLSAGQLELAVPELQQTVLLDPTNQYAQVELENALEELKRRSERPTELERAKREAEARAAELGPPRLDPASNVPISISFPDSTVEEVYESLGKIAGINILYDDKLDLKKKTSVELANVTFEKAMDILMLMHKHFYKVIDEHTILIADDTRQKRQEYSDQVVRTFYLSNAEPKQIMQLLRSLLESRKLSENSDLNAITIKDTPEVIKVAERLIKANDKAKGEVVVDLELLEINRTRLRRLGVDLSDKALTLVFGEGGERVALNNLTALKGQAAWSIGPVPSVLLNFLKSDSDSKTIARPQLRILEGETGKITIGDRVPIPATTFNTSQTIGGNVVPITSFTYSNVGIIVNVTPRVHHNKEITLELSVEVSSLAGSVEGTGGVSQPIIGTRTVETTIRLKDGETNLLAGLIKEEERTSLSGVPGLSDIPILRRLFGATEEQTTTNDIVLSVTPHIIRVPNIQPIDMVPLWVGTEERIQLRGVARNALGESPFASQKSWEEIEKELGGGEAAPVSGEKVKVGAETGEAAPEAPGRKAPAPAERRPRRGRRGSAPGGAEAVQAEPLPPEGAFGEPGPAPAPAEGAGSPEPALEKPPAETPEQPPAVAQLRLAPSARQVRVGDTVTVDVLVADARDVATVNFQLRYDESVLRFVPPGELGEFLQQGGKPADLQAVESAEGGLLVVSASRRGPEGASGSGRLVRLTFLGTSPGQADFRFSAAQVRGPDARAMPASFRVAPLEVVP